MVDAPRPSSADRRLAALFPDDSAPTTAAPWWRRRRTAIVLAVVVALAVTSLAAANALILGRPLPHGDGGDPERRLGGTGWRRSSRWRRRPWPSR
jgi:hypothetical protein